MPCAIPAADQWCLYRVQGYLPLTSGGPLERAPGRVGLRALGRHADRPDEAQELSAHGGDDLLLGLAFRQQPRVAGVQAVLGLPSNRLDVLALIALPSPQRVTHSGTVSVGPGRFDHDPAQVRVAGFADAAAMHARPARVLPRHCTAVAHQLPRMLKARQLAHLRHDRHRADLGNAAQALQCLDDRTHLLGHSLDRRIDRVLQTVDPIRHVLDLVQVIEQRRLLRRLLEDLLLHPGQILQGPRRGALGRAPAVAQQEFTEPVASPPLIALGREPGPAPGPATPHARRPAPTPGSNPPPGSCAPASPHRAGPS